MKKFFKDLSVSTFIAGFVSLLVGFSSSAVIVYEAALRAGATNEMAASWLGILCVSMGLLSFWLSYKSKNPIMFAWSTAGGALLYTSSEGLSLAELSGAFIGSAALIFIFGVSGLFEKLMNKIPIGVASGMLAGVLIHFALDVFTYLKSEVLIVSIMILFYIIGKIKFPKINIVMVLLAGFLVSLSLGKFHLPQVDFMFLKPEFIYPVFTTKAFMAVGLPLFVVTMASQNFTGIAVMRSCGYEPSISKLITASGVVNLLIAPFGGYALNLSALTAAICMGNDSHPDPSRRYTAAIISGFFYIIVGLSAYSVMSFFQGVPKELVMSLAGLSLMSTIGNGLSAVFSNENGKEASLMTFFVTASGVSLFGISSAFWGLLAGALVMIIEKGARSIHFKRNHL